MEKNIVIIGTSDTKGAQLTLLREKIRATGHRPILIDISMGGNPTIDAEVQPHEIAELVGRKIDEILASPDRRVSTNLMTEGALNKALTLLGDGQLDGIVAMGGTTMGLLGARIMAKLPFGIPKVIATPAAMPAYVGRLFGATDLTVMQLIMEIAGRNDLVDNAISQVAGAISGMVEQALDHRKLTLPRPSVALTQIGFSDNCAKNVETLLVEKGYHVYPFHAQGVSDRAMDRLIAQGFFDAVVEICPAGLIEERFKGNRPAGMARLDAAGDRGIPQVWAPCCLNLTGVGPTRHNREKYLASGKIFEMDETRAMTRFPEDELVIGAKLYAEKINKAKGPLKLVVPLRGWSSIDREGSVLYDPEQDRLFIQELKKGLRVEVDIQEVDANLEDPEVAQALVESLDQFMKNRG
ncbi:MAG: Tm-1-like ATP-binding domain-containing protein [Desulfomonilaceae bacterium]